MIKTHRLVSPNQFPCAWRAVQESWPHSLLQTRLLATKDHAGYLQVLMKLLAPSWSLIDCEIITYCDPR